MTLDGDATPTTTLYSISYDNTVSPTVKENDAVTQAKKQTKHNEKQHKKDKKSKREQKQAEKKKKLSAHKVSQTVLKQKPLATIQKEEKTQANIERDPALVEGDSVSGENVIESTQKSQDDVSNSSWIFQAITRYVSQKWSLWFGLFRLWL